MAIATYVDNTWQNQLWSRDMLFTLLTRVQRLSDIYLVGSFNHSSLALLLSQQSWWYETADMWIRQVDLLRTQRLLTNPPVRPIWTWEPSASVPLRQVNAVYVLHSPSTQLCYVGSTDAVADRLRQHNAGRGSLHTSVASNWALSFCIVEFTPGCFLFRCQFQPENIVIKLSYFLNSCSTYCQTYLYSV